MSFFILAQIILFFPILGSGIIDCQPGNCSVSGPLIKFPFRLQHLHPQHCGYPGFDLYCQETGETVLQLSSSVNVSLSNIDYVAQRIQVYPEWNCTGETQPNINLSASPFSFVDDSLFSYVFFNCSTANEESYIQEDGIPCLGRDGYLVVATSPKLDMEFHPFINCTKVLGVRSFPLPLSSNGELAKLKWSEPTCGRCESNHSFCSFINATERNQIQCIPKPLEPQKIKVVAGPSKVPFIAGATVGSLLLVATLAALFYVYKSFKTDKKIEKFLKDYKALKPTRFSYADLKIITKDFSQKLGEGGYGTVYKGKLSNEIYVAVKVLNSTKGNGEEFVNEVKTIGGIHHVNIVRLVGFCADGVRRALVYEYLTNDSLEKFIFQNGPKKNSLTWQKLQEVAIGTAKGIEYLHQGCDQQILHFDIKPHNILLDENHNPKICDFGLAKFCSKEQSAVSMTDARGTMGYIAPEMMSRTFGRVSYKSDVYSFGMVLLEMVGGRKVIEPTTDTSQAFFPKWVYDHLSKGGELTGKSDEEDSTMKKLVVVGLWCIQWYPTDRPSMKTVVQMLEGDGESLRLPPNPFPSTSNGGVGGNGRFDKTDLAIVLESDDNLVGQQQEAKLS